MNPLISVVVPIYNQEPYLAECLQSLLSQATERTEIWLIDDGSTDGSARICQDFVERYPARVWLIRQENHGLLKTRQIGIGHVTGDYILCVDSDDCLLDGAIAALTEVLDARHPDVVLFNATNDREKKTPLFAYPFQDGALFSGDGKRELYRLLCCTDQLNNIWAKCVRRELFSYPEVYADADGIVNGEDLYQSLPLVDRAESVVFLDRVLYYYRVTRTGMSRTYNPRHFSSEKKVCARRLEYAEKWGGKDGELTRGANRWIYRILRDVTRKLFVSDQPWQAIRREVQRLRDDPFYRAHYLAVRYDPNKRDLVLKSPLAVMRLWKALYSLKPRSQPGSASKSSQP